MENNRKILKLDQLKGLTINSCNEEEKKYVIKASTEWLETKDQIMAKNGKTKERKYLDIPVGNKQVHIELVSQRWINKNTGDTYQSQAPCIHPNHRITYRLYDWMTEKFDRLETDKKIAEQTGFERSTINKMMSEWYSAQNGVVNYKDIIVVPWTLKGNTSKTKYGIIHFGRPRLLYIADDLEMLQRYMDKYKKQISTIFIPFDLKLHAALVSIKKSIDIRITLGSYKKKIRDSLFDVMIEEIKRIPPSRRNLVDERIIENIAEAKRLFNKTRPLISQDEYEISMFMKSNVFQKYYSLTNNFLESFENEEHIHTYTVDDKNCYQVIQAKYVASMTNDFISDLVLVSASLLDTKYTVNDETYLLYDDISILDNKYFHKLYAELSLLEDKEIPVGTLPWKTYRYIDYISENIHDDFKKYSNEQIVYKYREMPSFNTEDFLFNDR